MTALEPRFSILMPTHDREDVIGFAIASVLGQTEGSFELLVVGDGCADGTAAIVEGFADERIRWFDLPKAPGFGYANRNLALREARGELIAFAAHDDLLLPDHLERLGARFEQRGVEWAYSRPVWVSDDGVLVPFAVDLRKRPQLHFFLDVANSIPASCVIHRRSCFERYGFWPEDVPSAADWELWKAIIRPSLGANLAYAPEATALHFRASWRGTSQWGPAPLHRWLRVAADDQVWPRALRGSVLEGELPQAAIWRALLADPQAWTQDLRIGVSEACDLLAWTGSAELDRLDTSLQLAHAESGAWQQRAEACAAESAASAHALELARAEIDAARAEIDAARAEIDALKSSESWRVTAPLRRIGTALRRP